MRKLLVSFVIILMFAFSLNKYNPIEEKKLVKGIKHVPRVFRPRCVCIRYPCPCRGDPIIKPSNPTKANK